MNPQTALWIILAVTLLSAAVAAPLAWEMRQEIQRAKKNLSNYAAMGCLTVLLGFGVMALWWYYATATDQIMLAVIPTASWLWGFATRLILNSAKKSTANPAPNGDPA